MIKASLLTAVLMTSALLHSEANAGSVPAVGTKKIPTNAVKDVYSGLKFNYLDQEDRLLIVKNFLQAIELEYALLPLKKERIGLDFAALKAEAIATESGISSILLAAADKKDEFAREKIAFLQASSNMDFLDRMQILVAKFKDTHFGIQEKISRPIVYNGLRLFRVQGKIHVGSMETKLLGMAGKLSKTNFDDIKIGDEVLAIDGVPVEQKIAELKPYIGGSSDEFIDSEAVLALTIRNFKYEKKNYVTFTFKGAGVYKMPLFVNNSVGATPRLDAITYFNKYNVPTDSVGIGMTYDKATNKWNDSGLAFQGYNTRRIQANLKGLSEYTGDNQAAAMRTGYYMVDGKNYGVLQLLTFASSTATKDGQTIPFLLAVRNFILELKENGAPLILDLRVNGGGNGGYPGAVLSILAREGSGLMPGSTYGIRMTHSARQIMEPMLYSEFSGEDVTYGATADELQQIISDALDNHSDYAPMYSAAPIPPDQVVKGFNNNIVALVTPDCISACDMMSFLLKESKRAIIIGTHSNGTGAGFRSSSEINAKWEDPLKMFSSNIPNFLFGRPGASAAVNIFGPNSVSEMCSENKPTVADIPYSTQPVDVMRSNLGWLATGAQVLDLMK